MGQRDFSRRLVLMNCSLGEKWKMGLQACLPHQGAVGTPVAAQAPARGEVSDLVGAIQSPEPHPGPGRSGEGSTPRKHPVAGGPRENLSGPR